MTALTQDYQVRHKWMMMSLHDPLPLFLLQPMQASMYFHQSHRTSTHHQWKIATLQCHQEPHHQMMRTAHQNSLTAPFFINTVAHEITPPASQATVQAALHTPLWHPHDIQRQEVSQLLQCTWTTHDSSPHLLNWALFHQKDESLDIGHPVSALLVLYRAVYQQKQTLVP